MKLSTYVGNQSVHSKPDGKTAAALAVTAAITLAATGFAGGMLYTAAEAYQSVQEIERAESERRAEQIKLAVQKFDLLVGNYKITTRNKGIFTVKIGDDKERLRLTIPARTDQPGCILTPVAAGKGAIEYSVTECDFDGPERRLKTVFFTERKGKIQMHFLYDRGMGDSLEKQ